MAQRSHVPKFGNWDGDNVPYTAYFENARKEKAGGIKINPNDPEQNPEAFSIGSNGISPNNGSYELQRHKGGGSSTHSSDTSVLKPKHQRKKSHRTKSNADTTNPPLPGPIDADDFSYRSVSVPKFGQWDENDPRSAEGFTVIFNKVKEEKQIAASKPPVPIQTTNNYQARQGRETRKKCCCLF